MKLTFLKKLWLDTMTRANGKYSRTSLTWFISFLTAISMSLYDCIHNGFNIAVFTIYIGYVFGTKWIDQQNKNINE